MILVIFEDKPILGIIIVFITVIAFLIIIPLLYEAIRKKFVDTKTDTYEKDKDNVESRIYELIFSKNNMSFQELKEYFSLEDDILCKYLSDMISKNVIELKEDKYVIKK